MESGVAQVREAQRKASLQLKNVGLATAIDLGESNDIHPLNKKDLAHRCVLQMNKLSFGEKNIVAEGPMAEAAELKENGRIVISFRQGTGSLKQAKSLEGIAIAANDGKYKFVEAYTEGDKVIALWNGKGIPASIRYAWENNPPSSIYNTEGLPAFYRFELEVTERADTFLELDGWGKGCVFLNGFNLGRFWEIGPQKRLYIPAPLLKEGRNEIIVFETEGKSTGKIALKDEPDIG